MPKCARALLAIISKEEYILKSTSNAAAKKSPSQTVKKCLLIALTVLLCIVLLSSVVLVFEAFVFRDGIPGNIVYKPAAEKHGNMSPAIKKGDYIILKALGDEELGEGDVISYYIPDKGFVLGRIQAVEGERYFVFGDTETAETGVFVSRSDIRGVWNGFRIPLVGWVFIFCQTVWGFVTALVLIIVIDILVSVLMRKKAEDLGKKDFKTVGLGLAGILILSCFRKKETGGAEQ